MDEVHTFITTSKIQWAFGMLPSQAKNSGCNGTFISVNWNAYRLLARTHNSWTHFPFLKATPDQSVFGHPLFERVLVCGKKRKEKIRDWWLPVGNSCQDRKTSVCEGKRRRKPHNQDLFCGLWLGQRISGTDFNYTKIWMYS